MKPEQKYQSLKDLAERMKITVSEQNLQKTGVRAKSGLCKVKEEYLFIMDKRKKVAEKIEILSECLSKMPHEGIYIVPAIRNLLKPEQKSIFNE